MFEDIENKPYYNDWINSAPDSDEFKNAYNNVVTDYGKEAADNQLKEWSIELENAIENNPIKAAEVLPEGSNIQKEAIEAIDGGKDAEVDNKVVGNFLSDTQLFNNFVKDEESKAKNKPLPVYIPEEEPIGGRWSDLNDNDARKLSLKDLNLDAIIDVDADEGLFAGVEDDKDNRVYKQFKNARQKVLGSPSHPGQATPENWAKYDEAKKRLWNQITKKPELWESSWNSMAEALSNEDVVWPKYEEAFGKTAIDKGTYLSKEQWEKMKDQGNESVKMSDTLENANKEWREEKLKEKLDSIINKINGNIDPTEADIALKKAADIMDPRDRTEVAGDIDDMAAEDNGVLSDIINQDENVEVNETEKPIITDEELQSSATEAPETIDTFNGLTDNNAAELADTMSAIEELYKIHNSLPKTSGKVDSDAMLKEIAKHTKDNEEYKPGRYNDFLFNFKETPIPAASTPNIDAPEVTGSIEGPQNVIQNSKPTSTSNGLPTSISTGTGNVSNGNVSTSNNNQSIITNGTPAPSGSAPISEDANAPEARSFGGFLKGNKNNVPMSKGISPDKNVSGSIKSGKGSLPSGGGHTASASTKAPKVRSDKQLDTVGIIQKIYTASRSWPVKKGYHTKQCGVYKVSVKEQEILVSGNGFEHKNIKNVPPEVIKDIGNNL